MSQKIELIVDILEQQSDIYSDLLDMADKKIKLIEDNDVKELEKFTKVEQSLILSNSKLENKRQEATLEVKEQYNLESVSISYLESITTGALKDRLVAVREKLEATISDLKAKNDISGKLLENKLEFVDFFLNLYTRGSSSDKVYEKDGNAPSKQQKINLFDQKA